MPWLQGELCAVRVCVCVCVYVCVCVCVCRLLGSSLLSGREFGGSGHE